MRAIKIAPRASVPHFDFFSEFQNKLFSGTDSSPVPFESTQWLHKHPVLDTSKLAFEERECNLTVEHIFWHKCFSPAPVCGLYQVSGKFWRQKRVKVKNWGLVKQGPCTCRAKSYVGTCKSYSYSIYRWFLRRLLYKP